MRGKRRNRGTWFPMLGQPEDEGTQAALGIQFTVDVAANGDPTLATFPITYDFPIEAGTGATPALDSLADIIGSEYICKRLLGSFHASNDSPFDSSTGLGGHTSIALTAGLYVARAGGPTEDQQENAPIGFGSGADTAANYSPGHPATAREPWMWRRTWMLGNARISHFATTLPVAATTVRNPWNGWPSTTTGGTLRSGTDIDVKSRRRVAQDERLFFAVEARGMPLGANVGAQSFIDCFLTLRMFGTLMKARQRGAF